MSDFQEFPLSFGAERHLLGTLTLPQNQSLAPVGLLLTNAGVIHRMGPHRINVKLARHLARQGIATLRFDLSGQGDSRSATGASDFSQQAVADIQAAMDHFGRITELQRFAMAGICSGADNAWATAQVDPRLVALCLIDGATYETDRTAKERLRKRLEGPIVSALLPFAQRKLKNAWDRHVAGKAPPPADEGLGRPQPNRDAYARQMQALVDRGVQVRLVFTGSLLAQYNHDSQFADAFDGHGFVSKVQADYRPDIDHTVTPVSAQRALQDLFTDWLRPLSARA